MGAAPSALGQLCRPRELSQRLVEIGAARQHEQHLVAQKVLAKERAQLGQRDARCRLHQVSLIPYRRARTGSVPPTNDVQTAPPSSPPTQREHTRRTPPHGGPCSELPTLPARTSRHSVPCPARRTGRRCGIGHTIDANSPGPRQKPDSAHDLPAPSKKALTNIRKHAPGANALIKIRNDITGLHVTVINTHRLAPPSPCPAPNMPDRPR